MLGVAGGTWAARLVEEQLRENLRHGEIMILALGVLPEQSLRSHAVGSALRWE